MEARYPEAAELYQQALPIYRQIGDQLGEAGCLWSMARLAAVQHNMDLAREASELAAGIYSNIGRAAQAQQIRDEFTQSQP
jgi:tetratricopeptide (TPR) repeat protein